MFPPFILLKQAFSASRLISGSSSFLFTVTAKTNLDLLLVWLGIIAGPFPQNYILKETATIYAATQLFLMEYRKVIWVNAEYNSLEWESVDDAAMILPVSLFIGCSRSTLDYLETRRDIDRSKLAFYGRSQGCQNWTHSRSGGRSFSDFDFGSRWISFDCETT